MATSEAPVAAESETTLFLCGDVMVGRGIDQILQCPNDPVLYESWVKDARDYVALAARVNGPILYPVANRYIWGDALAELDRIQPDLRLINLETSITTHPSPWPGKGIHYRMHPSNIGCLIDARIDACSLANNHVLDWDYPGLQETLATLKQAHIMTAGAGRHCAEAKQPAILDLKQGGRVLLLSCGLASGGIPETWAASADRSGVFLLPDLSELTVERIARCIKPLKQARDIAILSIHWGNNWGYRIDLAQRAFAHRVLDQAGVDLIHGHSSHHPRPIEVHHKKLIFYGCGDLINDYEGIRGHEQYRGDLSLMYFVTVANHSGQIKRVRMVPMQMRKLQLRHAVKEDAKWLTTTLCRVNQAFRTSCALAEDNSLQLHWH